MSCPTTASPHSSTTAIKARLLHHYVPLIASLQSGSHLPDEYYNRIWRLLPAIRYFAKCTKWNERQLVQKIITAVNFNRLQLQYDGKSRGATGIFTIFIALSIKTIGLRWNFDSLGDIALG